MHFRFLGFLGFFCFLSTNYLSFLVFKKCVTSKILPTIFYVLPFFCGVGAGGGRGGVTLPYTQKTTTALMSEQKIFLKIRKVFEIAYCLIRKSVNLWKINSDKFVQVRFLRAKLSISLISMLLLNLKLLFRCHHRRFFLFQSPKSKDFCRNI